MRWGDMDAYGHINNVQVLRLLEEARIQAFGPPGGTGLPGTEPSVPLFSSTAEGVLALVVEHRVKYTAPLDYRNIPAAVDLWVAAVKPASLHLCYRILDPVTESVCAKAETVLAFVDAASGRAMRLTEGQRRLAMPYLGEPVFC
jgi:acyl-CoA thioester hydrolase